MQENMNFDTWYIIIIFTHHSNQRRIFIFLKEGGGKISSGVQAAPLSELRQGLGVRVKDFHTK